MPNRDVTLFWDIATPMVVAGQAEEGTMMGHPCLRANGAFFATAGHSGDELILKLPANRVADLIAAGTGQPFAPAGRTFKEWVAIPEPDHETWHDLIHEARAYVSVPKG